MSSKKRPNRKKQVSGKVGINLKIKVELFNNSFYI